MTEEKKPYREGHDPDSVTEEETPVDTSIPSSLTSEEQTPGWYSGENVDSSTAPTPDKASEEAPTTDTEVFTAVLLVQTHTGTVFPITNLDNLKLHHQATPHEVLRMCYDAADQVSSVRIIGEVLRNTHMIVQQHSTAMLQTLMGGPPQQAAEPPRSDQEVEKNTDG